MTCWFLFLQTLWWISWCGHYLSWIYTFLSIIYYIYVWSLIKENSTFRIKFQCTCVPHFLGLPSQPPTSQKKICLWMKIEKCTQREEVCGRNPITFLRENKALIKKMQWTEYSDIGADRLSFLFVVFCFIVSYIRISNITGMIFLL